MSERLELAKWLKLQSARLLKLDDVLLHVLRLMGVVISLNINSIYNLQNSF